MTQKVVSLVERRRKDPKDGKQKYVTVVISHDVEKGAAIRKKGVKVLWESWYYTTSWKTSGHNQTLIANKKFCMYQIILAWQKVSMGLTEDTPDEIAHDYAIQKGYSFGSVVNGVDTNSETFTRFGEVSLPDQLP